MFVQATDHQYKAIHSFGLHGTELEQFEEPYSIAVNKKTGKIAIANNLNHRVQLFDHQCKYLRTMGDKGLNAERIKFPCSVEFTTSDEVIVIHGEGLKPLMMFLFTEHGDFIKVISQHLIDPWSVSVSDDGHMIVCDSGDKSVKILSYDGTGLVESFKGPYGFGIPASAVYHGDRFLSYITHIAMLKCSTTKDVICIILARRNLSLEYSDKNSLLTVLIT